MYEVELKLGQEKITIHEEVVNRLTTGSVKKGINCIDSFSFDILPNNKGFNSIYEFKTLISVYNTLREEYEFQGRVLQCNSSMSDNGLIAKSVVCESFFGYLQDTEQSYVYEQNWTPLDLLTHLLDVHNEMLETEPEKHFKVGNVFTDENIYVGIQRESTWQCIMNKIIGKVGGEIELRIEEDGMYIDIVEERGSIKETTIELSKNMKSITQENYSSSYITRLIPLGAKIKKEEIDQDGNATEIETEERVDITSVNEGKNYIDDDVAIKNYGIHIKHEYWDDVNEPLILKTKAINFLAKNNKVLRRYSINALDLAILGIDISYIDVCNYYPVINALLGIEDVLRVITKTIDVVNEQNTSFEIGDKFKTLLDLEVEKNNRINNAINTIEKVEKNYTTDQIITNVTNELHSVINQTASQIENKVSETYTTKNAFEEYQETVSSQFTQTTEGFNMTFSELIKSITDVDGKVNENYNELIKYIQFKGGTIILGEVENPLTLTLSNDRLSFLDNGVEVAYISDKKLYIYDGEFLHSCKIGRWVLVPRTNGNLSFTWI